jgi:hypothetical protein
MLTAHSSSPINAGFRRPPPPCRSTSPSRSRQTWETSGSFQEELVSTLNWKPGQTRANNAIVSLGTSGDITVHVDQASGTVHFIIDVNGYFQ